jgi:hypothetical protein
VKQAEMTDVEKAFEVVKKKNPYRHRPIQREFVSDIIANKREIFLAEYVLQTKRQSLTKLQEKANLAERELNVSENKLEQDACLFDEFLRETDKSAVDAMHEAERISQIRQNLTDQEKKFKLHRSALQSELSRSDESLFHYLEMKRFIWQVYSDQHPEDKHAKRIISYINMMIKDAGSPNNPTLVDQALAREMDTTDQIVPFKHDVDILSIITELEDANLQMIHHFQHSEEVIEDMKLFQSGKKLNLQTTLNELKQHVKIMQDTIASREKRAKELQFICKMYEIGSQEQDKQEMLLIELGGKIEKVYKVVVGRLEIKIDGLMMLTSIENRLQDLIEEVESFPTEKVRFAQKFKDKQRRLKLREEKLEQQKQKQEERAKRAVERAATVAIRSKGRKLVFRSDPLKKGHSEQYNQQQHRLEDMDKDAEYFRPDNMYN